MADPRAFISFDFDHNESEKHLFAGQSKNSKTPFSVQDWSSKSHLPELLWEAMIEQKIIKCNMLIVLVGKYMATSKGVAKEIAMAKRNNIPIFGVYVGGANTNSNLPIGLLNTRVLSWDWDKISSAISQMLREGKNKISA